MNLSPKSGAPSKRARKSHIFEREATDWYVEPLWTSRRLFEVEHFDGPIYDPAAGRGTILYAARRAGIENWGSDINPRDDGIKKLDFLDLVMPLGSGDIVSNPPYACAEHFVSKAIDLCPNGKVAMLLPAGWIQGDKRSRWLEESPLVRVWFLTPRPSMPPGDAPIRPAGGRKDYAWFIWNRRERHLPGVGARIGWLRRDG